MVDYPYAGILVADAVTFRRATNAAVTVYDVNDTNSTTPLVLKDLSGLPLPNPLTSTSDGFVRAFVTTSEGVKLVGGGLTVVEYSHVGIKDAAVAAADAAQGAADSAATAAGNTLSTATVDSSGQLVVTKANGASVNAGNVKGPKGDKGDTGTPGSNVLPTDDAIEAAILGTGTKTKAALSATYAPKGTTIPKWVTATAYTAGQQVISPNGDVVSSIADHTSGATFNPANWNLSPSFATPAQAFGNAIAAALIFGE